MHKKQLDANTFGVVFYRYKAKSEACCGAETIGFRRGSVFVRRWRKRWSRHEGVRAVTERRRWIVFRSRHRIEAAWDWPGAYPDRSDHRSEFSVSGLSHAAQREQHPRADGGHHRRGDGPASRHPDARYRPIRRIEPRAGVCRGRAIVSGRRFGDRGHPGDDRIRRARRRGERALLRLRAAAASVHHHAGDA